MYLYYIRFSFFVKERFQVILCAAEIWRSPEAGIVRAKGKLLPLIKILRALRKFGQESYPPLLRGGET